jgi:hypothetical protein
VRIFSFSNVFFWLRLVDRFGSGFLQIPHWLCITVIPLWVAIPSFFGHPCLRLHFPFSQGNGRTFTSLLTTMPVAPPNSRFRSIQNNLDLPNGRMIYHHTYLGTVGNAVNNCVRVSLSQTLASEHSIYLVCN